LGSSTGSSGTPVFVVTGTSGAGKGTLEKALLVQIPELALAVSATTRERREGEEDGREYWFISDEEFDEKLRAGSSSNTSSSPGVSAPGRCAPRSRAFKPEGRFRSSTWSRWGRST